MFFKKKKERTTPTISRLAKYAIGTRLEEHRNFFLGTSIGGSKIRAKENRGLQWKVVSEWDASHAVPRRGDGKRINSPQLVEWSPVDDQIVTACDAFGASRWMEDGCRSGGSTSRSAYGTAERFFWSPDGKKTLLESSTALTTYWHIHDENCNLYRAIIKEGCGWGRDFLSQYGFNRTKNFNPWRPGANQIVVERHGGGPILDLLDVASFPKSIILKRSTQVSPIESIDLCELGALDESVFRYAWHPSGQYIAVTSGSSDSYEARRVHIIHWNSGEIVATIPQTVIGLGWSPGGRLFVCHSWTAPYTDDWVTDLRVWDSHEWALRRLTPEEQALPRVRQLDTSERGESIVSADGQHVLSRIPRKPEDLANYSKDSENPSEVLALSGGAEHAAWSYRDPKCFASVGGLDSKVVRVWKMVPQRP